MAKSIKLHIKDFGPIHEADLDIKPLTVFIGRNDTGKSYAAMLLYSLIKAHMISKAKRSKYESMKLKEYLKNSITKQIERIFDNYLEELVNKNSKDMKMQFTFKVDSKGYDFLISKDQTNIQLFDDTKLEDLVFKRDTILLPSSRSGLLQTYLLIEAERIEDESELVETDLTKEYPLPGNIADFIYLLLKYSIKQIGENKELIKRFEKILGGKIISELGRLYFHDERYGLDIDINKTSSGIQELTPSYLVIKHFDLKNIMLIIEEPEAHLHPELIINMTRVLTWLVRKGAYVIITTHSDYLFSKLNLLIKLSKVDKDKRVKLGYTEDEYLKPDEVSAYLFKYSQELRSSMAEKLTVGDEGVPEDEFADIVIEIKNEYVKVDLYEGREDSYIRE
jgi:predicted ATPase